GAYVASFIGFAPATKPRFVIAVVVNRPKGSHYGATVAAPVFREIAEKALWYYRVPSDSPTRPEIKPKEETDHKRLV
ncbi:MAG: penicillin-binding transpeptidase domain-containing protein, partial [Armatimonadetes bacterium]|nr:penicillin-binding transpeptidase domain-containing protein [Armatimonadota bacterium]